MELETKSVLAAKMNAHRQQWNGTICAQPQSWTCGAEAAFREDRCAADLPFCFHLDTFKPSAPCFAIPDPSVIAAVREQPRLLDDQVLVFYGGRFGTKQGVVPNDAEHALYGLYRVKRAKLDESRAPYRLIIEPHADCWAMFPRMQRSRVTLRPVKGVAYLKQIRIKALIEGVDQAVDELRAQQPEGWTQLHDKQLKWAKQMLPQWLAYADEARAKLPPRQSQRSVLDSQAFPSALAEKLGKLKIVTAVRPIEQAATFEEARTEPDVVDGAPEGPVATAVSSPSASDVDVTPCETTEWVAAAEIEPAADQSDGEVAIGATLASTDNRSDEMGSVPDSIPEPSAKLALGERVDTSLIAALSLAFATKSLVILTGPPGAGKSWIASRLLDDPNRERTVIVPVASTWRGREDLLGYVNPIHGRFEPTEFASFLCDAEEAWNRGDRRMRLVVFEEFNLSQPEHWLSDLLVRLEYGHDLVADRTVVFGGHEFSGRPGRPCRVVLVPSLRFVATLNNDHTVKPLSPRVLDRAALIEVSSSGREALLRAGLTLSDEMADLIDDLNDLLAPRGAAFSMRSARSLQRAIEASTTLGLDGARVLDLVLVQEVLSRVRLLAGDPRDEQLLTQVQAWSRKPECAALTGCAARIADWTETLAAGRDVFQA